MTGIFYFVAHCKQWITWVLLMKNNRQWTALQHSWLSKLSNKVSLSNQVYRSIFEFTCIFMTSVFIMPFICLLVPPLINREYASFLNTYSCVGIVFLTCGNTLDALIILKKRCFNSVNVLRLSEWFNFWVKNNLWWLEKMKKDQGQPHKETWINWHWCVLLWLIQYMTEYTVWSCVLLSCFQLSDFGGGDWLHVTGHNCHSSRGGQAGGDQWERCSAGVLRDTWGRRQLPVATGRKPWQNRALCGTFLNFKLVWKREHD